MTVASTAANLPHMNQSVGADAVAIDPITLEVVRNALAAIADEMALIIMRSAYSPVVRDSMDYSTALCDANGQVVAQGLTLAVQLGSFPDIMRLIAARDFCRDLRPGDILIANDPYGSGGQHLPDIYVIKPIFVGEDLCAFATTMAHHCDVGGLTPGSVAIHATEIHQEGLRLPLLKLYEQGKPNQTLFSIIERNTRQPVQVMGDLRAQLSACSAGERGFVALLEKYGTGRLRRYTDALQDHAETRMRAAIAAIPDGRYTFEDYIDGVGERPERLAIRVTISVRGDVVEIDFSGTSKQVSAGINCPIAMVHSAAYCAIRCIAEEDVPNCDGYMRPVRILAPTGTIVNPLAPAACGARGVIGYRVFDAIMGALAQVVPERVIAGCEGGPSLFAAGGWHEGRPFVLTEVMVGTWGARATLDGVEGISNPAANLSNQPVELIEATLPIEIVRYGMVKDSGGPGLRRGGLAFEREFRFLADKTEFTIRSDRRQNRPYGVAGGSSGSSSMHLFKRASAPAVELPTMPMQSFLARRGDTFRLVSAGGGGFGPSLERAPDEVLDDVMDDKVSRERALIDYGVVLDETSGRVDVAGTQAERSVRRGRQNDCLGE
jgi:N-methylhydantoinase B